ncbi:PfkB domain protein [Pedobacter sp. BAL39]|uniref:sugar kinase n=1 Tax=Pedobacter sp. BAL39 TaxID=391596 RepID=UPI0001559323|nr:sugar kinase [Pedobacter sp. BAL39]EDM36050.1 PfkB domain protein [Pedobacter sp. BAL39]
MDTFLIICFGELMLRMNPPSGLRFIQSKSLEINIAGAEANVSVLLSQLGVPARYLSRIPENDLALLALQELRKYGVDASEIIKGGERMALYFIEHGNHVRSSQVIYDRAHSSFASLKKGMISWEKALKGGSVFHWSGVAAALSQSAAEACLEAIEAARLQGLKICSDFNYRKTLWKYGKQPAEIMPPLLAYSDIAVADLDAVKVYFGIETDEGLSFEARFQDCYQQLLLKMPGLKTLGMSFRKVKGLTHEYSAALAHEGDFFYSAVHEVPYITDQVGSGDAFTGGMLAAMAKGLHPQEIVDWAAACGILKQSIHGDWALIREEEVIHFINNGANSKINR